MYESIGQRLRRLRLEKGLSQRQLAEPGITYAYISRVENEDRRPSVRAMRRLAVKLDVSEEYLEFGTDTLRELLVAVESLYERDIVGPGVSMHLKGILNRVKQHYGYE